jgi:hypothetical protein
MPSIIVVSFLPTVLLTVVSYARRPRIASTKPNSDTPAQEGNRFSAGVERSSYFQSTKNSELTFRALLKSDGTRDVRFERTVAG